MCIRDRLGDHILGTEFSFDIEIRYGAGAFVCGEETALIHSMEGKRGEPTLTPPFPAESGYLGKPTHVNNVETLANIPIILTKGAEWFATIGTERSKGKMCIRDSTSPEDEIVALPEYVPHEYPQKLYSAQDYGRPH